ncbi:LOW QUALITY PROTEIN: coiled-coil domain-containing protein 17-like [Rhinophrynus dorsalis]
MTDYLRCPSCNMTFKSSLLLEKHREKFCIGGDIGRVRETQTPEEMVTINQREDSRAYDQESQLRYLEEAHSKQINEIMSQNKLLEKQRDDIVQRLNEIKAQSRNTDYLEKMIKHLNAQEQKNELLLATMKQQIDMMQLESMKRRNHSRQSDTPASRRIGKVQPSFQQTYIPFYGSGKLSSEISALRLTYLQNGGNDQLILAHLQDLLMEAQLIEQREKRTRSIRKKNNKAYGNPKWHLNEKLITLEIENQQLEDQLFQLQLQRQKSIRLPKTSGGELEKNVRFPRFMKEQTHQNIKTLNAELEVLKQELEIQRLKRHTKTSHTQRTNRLTAAFPSMEENKREPPNIANNLLNFSSELEPAPYDPITGFVVFYDYILGLDPSYRVCRLAVSLYSGGLEMGSSSPLPPVYCETAVSKFQEDKKQNIAILATKQAVPRVRPSPNISLIIELQAAGGYDPYGQEVSRLISRGWVKLDIFDHQNRVISGYWKVPIRILPVKPSLTTGALNGVPQLEYTELYVRLINARDVDAQSLNPIDINNAAFYKYPPLTAAYVFPEDVLLPAPFYSSPYIYPDMQRTYGDIVDSPPSRDKIMTH